MNFNDLLLYAVLSTAIYDLCMRVEIYED